MSKLIDKARGINFDDDDDAPTPAPAPAAPTAAAAVPPARPRTAIGAISASLALGRGVEAENRALKDRLKAFEDAKVVEFLDPALVTPSRFANRHEQSFSGAEFAALKAEIGSTGRNVQPIKVRRMKAVGEGAEPRYEIAFGHRRHRACLELGLPVAAIVEDLTDGQLFEEMERENRERANLSPWEQGQMYKRALDAGLFPSLRRLATALGVQASNASTAVQLASLPEPVVAAFGSPLLLQYRWAARLQGALDADRDGVLKRAAELAGFTPRLPAKQVLARLLGVQEAEGRAAATDFLVNGKRVGTMEKDAAGQLNIRIAAGVLGSPKERKLVEFLNKLLSG